MNGGFWLSIGLVALVCAMLLTAWRTSGRDSDLEWQGRDLRDLETGGHRKPPAPWWRRWLGRR